MATTIKEKTFLWLAVVLVLVVNAVMLIIPIFINSGVVQNLIKPFTVSVFLMEGIFYLLPAGVGGYSGSDLRDTGYMICVLFVVVFAILDNLLSSGKTGTENEQQEQQDSSSKGGSGSFNFMTLIYIVIIWITYMMIGMNLTCGLKPGKGYEYKILINPLFVYIFRLGTIQYVYGMYVWNEGPPLWLYLVYMIPQALLWPLAALISYYHHKCTSDMGNCKMCFCAILAGALCYMGFRMMYQFQQYFKSSGDTKNKIIQGVTMAVGFLWMVFIKGIYTMNDGGWGYRYD
ncbi:hypothetical protein M9Y10_010835 [Tritrichomonas musculus]|uniref:Uncharacterized protein n=1 Tax=Tritrichomonas musculus TaxID=1915356 RepID=A0ABR2IN23_9EUKA